MKSYFLFILYVVTLEKSRLIQGGRGGGGLPRYGDYGGLPSFNISDFQPLKKQVAFLKDLASKCKYVTLKVIGNTKIEGKDYVNDIHLVIIGNQTDPILFFDCNIHAREWISSSTCHYVIEQLAKEFEKTEKSYLKSFQWQFIPNANPDGYQYTFKGPGDKYRLWRKNRRPTGSIEFSNEKIKKECYQREKDADGDGCAGVDLNRNFPGGWGKGTKEFVRDSKLPWTMQYKGPKPLSEPESQTLDKHITANRDNILSAISIHSYGQIFGYPKGWLTEDDPEQMQGSDRKRMHVLAKYMNKPLNYSVGNVFQTFGPNGLSSGATDDYYYVHQGIKVAYTWEMDPKDKKGGGFKIDKKFIKPVGDKIFAAMKRMAYALTYDPFDRRPIWPKPSRGDPYYH